MPVNLPLAAAAVFGLTGVVLGALGAHALGGELSERGREIWDTAVTYHLAHAIALLAVGVLFRLDEQKAGPLKLAALGFAVGTLLFSGSLYVLALGGPRIFGPLTPVGGLALCAGWLSLVAAARR